jgi:hypothetical protein
MPRARTSLAAAAALAALLVVVGCASDDDAACETNSDQHPTEQRNAFVDLTAPVPRRHRWRPATRLSLAFFQRITLHPVTTGRGPSAP